MSDFQWFFLGFGISLFIRILIAIITVIEEKNKNAL